MAVIKTKSISQFCIKLCGDFFLAKKKVKDPMLDGFLNNFTKTFSIQREFLRSAGENNAHCNFNCTLKIILQLF